MNVLASDKRIELALGKHPDRLGEELITFMEEAMPPGPKVFFKHPGITKRIFSALPRKTCRPTSQEVVINPDLNDIPVITSWPEDGGPFITLPQVFTYDPHDGKRNVGMYRMQVFDGRTTGMHWQIQRAAGFTSIRLRSWAGSLRLPWRWEPILLYCWLRLPHYRKELTRLCSAASSAAEGQGW